MATCINCFRTKSEMGICPFCGYNHEGKDDQHPMALKPGTVLANRYIVGRVLGQGGFGITYVALDRSTQSRVALKEYLPAELCMRESGATSLQVYSAKNLENYEYGKKQFLDEAKTLAELVGNEHIVRILSYFEENATAYFAMEFMEGVNLKQYMQQIGRPLNVEETNRILLPIMEALDWVHSKGIIHRDISPDNIMIRGDGIAKLIDFGAARYSTGEVSRSLDVVLKHGFAPKEQYMRHGRQGPFTDVYSMAATYYYAITGRVPPDAVERTEEDELISPSTLGVKISLQTEDVLLKALAVSSQDRYRTMREFYTNLIQSTENPFATETVVGSADDPEKSSEPGEPRRIRRPASPYPLSSSTGSGNPNRQDSTPKNNGKDPHPGNAGPAKAAAPQRSPQPVKNQKGGKKTGLILGIIAVISAVIVALIVLLPNISKGTNEVPGVTAKQNHGFRPSGQIHDSQMVGSTVTFGSYEQDNDLSNGKEPIEWIVLASDGDACLLVSRYGLDVIPYHEKYENITWETCSLRTWLNEVFLKNAFSSSEQKCIMTTAVDNSKMQSEGKPSVEGNETLDKLFLLSIYEANMYFNSDEERLCEGTEYAKEKGYSPYTSSTVGWWWLRTLWPHELYPVAAFVFDDGSLRSSNNVNSDFIMVRPAMWVTIGAEKNTETASPAFEAEETPEAGIQDKDLAEPVLADNIRTTGSIVTFGLYEQDNDLSNGKEPIEWIVLDVQDEKSLLISRYELDCQPYQTEIVLGELVTWESSFLRNWLNGTFLESAFSKEEQSMIPTVTVTAAGNPEHDIDPGRDTQDQIFLLSIDEASLYFGSDEERKCAPTKYVIKLSTWADNLIRFHGYETYGWWLRCSSNAFNNVYVNEDGSIKSDGGAFEYAVRPAMWIDLE